VQQYTDKEPSASRSLHNNDRDGAEHLPLALPIVLQQLFGVWECALLVILYEQCPLTTIISGDREELTGFRLRTDMTVHLRRFITFSHHEIIKSYIISFMTLSPLKEFIPEFRFGENVYNTTNMRYLWLREKRGVS
jgi:hypothetical protein